MSREYVVLHDEKIEYDSSARGIGKMLVSKKRTFEAASAYKGKKVAVLNFANSHHIGGAPWSAGAQEESLCRISTLYPCLEVQKKAFYDRHVEQWSKKEIDSMGNDDLIFTPDVTVFKSDESAPKLLDESEWYKVDVITSAAPELSWGNVGQKYERVMESRINKILQVAAKEKEQVLILGAFGCGAFGNPPDVVAKLFKKALASYSFETVEFAVFCRDDRPGSNYEIFCKGIN